MLVLWVHLIENSENLALKSSLATYFFLLVFTKDADHSALGFKSLIRNAGAPFMWNVLLLSLVKKKNLIYCIYHGGILKILQGTLNTFAFLKYIFMHVNFSLFLYVFKFWLQQYFFLYYYYFFFYFTFILSRGKDHIFFY